MNDFFIYIRSFLLDYLPKLRCFSENTSKSYKDALNIFIYYLRYELNISISQITCSILNREIIIGFLDWLENCRNNSIITRNQRLLILRSFFKYIASLDSTKIALQLEVQNIPLKKTQGRIVDFLSENSLKVLLSQPDLTKPKGIRNQFFMILMYDTAARCGELLKMKVCDLRYNIQYPVAHLLGKGNKSRLVSLMGKTVDHCKKYMSVFHNPPINNDYLFYNIIHGVKQPLSADTVAAFLKKYGDSARAVCPEIPLRIHPHQLRHTRAIHYYRDGMPLNLVAEQLGHSSLESTKIYAYADTEMKRAAIEKAEAKHSRTPRPTPIWENDDDMILKLSGLK
jgi:site-specific recombinase XerD